MGQPKTAESKDSAIIHGSAEAGAERRDLTPEIRFEEMKQKGNSSSKMKYRAMPVAGCSHELCQVWCRANKKQ